MWFENMFSGRKCIWFTEIVQQKFDSLSNSSTIKFLQSMWWEEMSLKEGKYFDSDMPVRIIQFSRCLLEEFHQWIFFQRQQSEWTRLWLEWCVFHDVDSQMCRESFFFLLLTIFDQAFCRILSSSLSIASSTSVAKSWTEIYPIVE